jgi:hypothetical protein
VTIDIDFEAVVLSREPSVFGHGQRSLLVRDGILKSFNDLVQVKNSLGKVWRELVLPKRPECTSSFCIAQPTELPEIFVDAERIITGYSLVYGVEDI